MAYQFEESPGLAYALQTECREVMKCRLLADILTDIDVCKLEGWDWKEYPRQIENLMHDILNGDK